MPNGSASSRPASVDLDEQGARVEQNLTYLVSYEPVDHFLLEVPRSLAGRAGWNCSSRISPLPPWPCRKAATTRRRRCGCGWPCRKACIGVCRLTVRYRLALQKPAAADHTVLGVPLIVPVEGELAGNRLTIAAAAGLRVEACPGAWTAVEAATTSAAPGGVQLTAAKRAGRPN